MFPWSISYAIVAFRSNESSLKSFLSFASCRALGRGIRGLSSRYVGFFCFSVVSFGFVGVFALVLPDDRGRVLAEHEAILRGQRKIDFMYRFLRPDGEVRNVHCLGKAVIKDDGRLIFSGTVQDVTERTENLEKLRRSESLLQIAGRIARMGGWEIDLHSRRVSWSDEVCALHGVPPGTLVSVEDAIAFYAPQWRQHITQAFDACVM